MSQSGLLAEGMLILAYLAWSRESLEAGRPVEMLLW